MGSLRDVVFSLVVLGLAPLCFRRPFIGLLTFSWLAYMRTQDLTWGFARHQRWSFLIAIVTFLGWIAHSRGKLFPNDLRCWVMLALTILLGVGLYFAEVPTKYELNRYLEYCKIIGVALFTAGVIKNRNHLRLLVWVIALSFGFYGVKVGLAGVLSGGSLVVRQGPGGNMEDNNDFCLALCMALPLMIQLATSERREVFRRAMMVMAPLTVLTVILTHSRGGFLSLVAVFLMLVWRSRNRFAAFSLIVAAGVVAVIMAPESYKERIGSIANYKEDGSAMGRLRAWKTAINMARDNPILGVGFNKFQQHYLDYSDEAGASQVRVAHNSYLQIWAECGTPAILLYLFLIFATFWDMWRVRRIARKRYRASWIINYATMFETSMVAFVVGAVFLNRAHFDLFYHYVAMALIFGRIARSEMQSTDKYPLASGRRQEVRSYARPGFARRTGFGPARKLPAPTGGFR